MDMDKLSYEIFSILENRFLFGGAAADHQKPIQPQLQQMKSGKHTNGKVRILSIDGGSSIGGLLAAHSLCLLESLLRRKSGDPKASISDFFDVAAGTGAGGILAALLFTRGKDGRPLFSAERALDFLLKHHRKLFNSGLLRRVFRPPYAAAVKLMRRTFGELTLKDTVKPLLVPCFDLSSRAPFVFSRADAMEMDGCDFEMRNVCVATAATDVVELRSVDGSRKIAAVDGGVAMNNPTAAAITHVLNNKQEFPFVNDVDDVLVVSLGNGEAAPSLVGIAGEAASDMVDQAVSMAFGHSRTTNYVRIQGFVAETKMDGARMGEVVEKILGQKNVESVLFKGKKMSESTNIEKLEMFASELVKEQERRKGSILPTVVLKHPATTSPRTSSATSLSTLSSTTTS